MPSKSDSAGKLHQYFTALALHREYPDARLQSPLTNDRERDIHLSVFNVNEIESLNEIGILSANIIIDQIGEENVSEINDIGVNSGAVGHTNTDDLVVITASGEEFGYSLKCATNVNQILSKNMGAGSLLSSYFNSRERQVEFNQELDTLRLSFLNEFFGGNETNLTALRHDIDNSARESGTKKARFVDYQYMNAHRDVFLRRLRDNLLEKIERIDYSDQANAINLILDTNKHHIIAIYGRNNSAKYVYLEDKDQDDILRVSRRGNDSVAIYTEDYEIGFRYKFESGITSSIKLVGDYRKI
ncbi:hypothetical protein [Photobacterium toruni]|uniref:hypothetical protein n=1 Tax=Photobacterium toruni TaxID=1935446 RepID=UPI00211084F1|nr:hypothetical protein [Photobacterium toruni]